MSPSPNLHRGFFLLVGIFLLSGCASYRYKADYGGFQGAYAQNSNQQLLLNLARLDQHEPTYFLQFGQISVQYNWNSSIAALVNDTIPTSRKTGVLGGQTSLTGTASEQPQFTFIPVTDEKVAQQLLQPVDPEVLYTLFQQGWPVDQLMRLIVDRIEVPQADGSVVTYFNTPGRALYPAFLKTCAAARELQKDGHLVLEAQKIFTPAVEGVAQKDPPRITDILSLQKGGGPSGDPGAGGDSQGKTSGGESKSSGESQLVWGKTDAGWTVGTYDLTPIFKLDTHCDETFARLSAQASYQGKTLANMQAILAKGFSVQGRPISNQEMGLNAHLFLRSFLGILSASAQEQSDFKRYILEKPDVLVHIPDIEQQPIIQLKWDAGASVLPPVVDLNYRSQYYQVTDPETAKTEELASWNRDVFRLMVQLSSQVSIDISKYPLPTTLQVSP